jgi:hypothetical protein
MAQAVLIAAVNAQVALAPLIAGAVRWLVLIFAGAAALTQLGIAREILESRLRKRDKEDGHLTPV